jgi:hypothetical protein
MGEDWKELDVLSSLESIQHPPESMWLYGDHEDEVEKRSAIIREHYNEILEELKDGGYERLLTIKDRLESHLSEVDERLRKWKGRVLNSRLQYRAYRKRLLDFAAEKADEDAEVEEVEEIEESLRETPIGRPWFTGDAVNADLQGNWNPSLTYAASSSPSLSDVTISYTPKEDVLPLFGLHQKYREYDSDSFDSAFTRSFSGDTTWEEVFESLKEQRDAHIERKNRTVKTAKLLRFRLSVIETVLYRFETFGSVDRLTEGEAMEIAKKDRNGDSRRMMDWEINAAQLYAYVQEHGQPSSKDEWEDETKVSTRQAWDRLRENDYGIGTGVNGLHNALKEWAPEFEQKYGTRKARRAASPFNWPDEHEA